MKPNKSSRVAAAAMQEFVDGTRSRAHFRYPIDGAWSDLDRTFHATLDEIFGPGSPNSAQSRWVRSCVTGLIR
jgi:hypothetical protein